MTPLVSVHVVTYNQVHFIRETLDSILNQSYSCLQIVVADDGSTDGTAEVVMDYARRHPDLIVALVGGKNIGISANCNRALRECKGDYVAFLGGDDVMLPGKISRQVALMESDSGCAICYHDLDVFDSNSGRTLYRFNQVHRPYSGSVKGIVKHGTVNGGSSTMVRASAIPKAGFDESLPVASDWLFWIETMISGGGTIRFIDEPLAKYRRHDKNITSLASSALTQALRDNIVTCSKVISQYPQLSGAALYRLGTILRGLRHHHDGNYFDRLVGSLRCSMQLKTAVMLFAYCATFGRLRP